MTTNLFVIANVKQLRTDGSFRILLPFFRTYWGVGVLNSALFSGLHNRVEFGTILEGLRNFGEGGFEPPNPPTPTPLGTPLILRNLNRRCLLPSLQNAYFVRRCGDVIKCNPTVQVYTVYTVYTVLLVQMKRQDSKLVALMGRYAA